MTSAAKPDPFEAQRPRLLSLAYQMLGEIQAAEDIVQDAWLRWQGGDREDVDSPGAWLYRVVTNLCLDQSRSARARREEYRGPWLPEPIVDSGPAEAFELARECELALLWSLERLTEEERAAFLLSQVFETPYSDIAAMLGRSESACRQIVSRARKRLSDSAPRYATDAAAIEDMLLRFAAAAAAGKKDEVLDLLAPDVVAVSDGGGVVTAAIIPLHGPERVAQVYTHIASKNQAGEGLQLLTVNDRPAIARLQGDDNDMISTVRLDEQGLICWIYTMRNPHKLASARQAILRSL